MSGFQLAPKTAVRAYRDFNEVFENEDLLQTAEGNAELNQQFNRQGHTARAPNRPAKIRILRCQPQFDLTASEWKLRGPAL